MKSFKLVLFVVFVCMLALSALAQDNQNTPKPQPTPVAVKEEKKEPPATAIIPADVVKNSISPAQKDAQIAQQQVQILTLQIQKAQDELTKLQEQAKKAGEIFQVAVTTAAAKVGIPAEALPNYQIDTQSTDGAWILRKAEKPAPAKN